MELSEPMSMRSIARSEGGYVDEINGAVAAWTPSDAYFVSLSDRTLGVIFSRGASVCFALGRFRSE